MFSTQPQEQFPRNFRNVLINKKEHKYHVNCSRGMILTN